MLTIYILILAIAAVVARLLYTAIRVSLTDLRKVPGPLLARFTDAWYLWRVAKAKFEVDNQALHDRYGPVVRYGPNRFSLRHPDAQKTVYGHGSQFTKSSWYNAWSHPGRWNLFADRDIKRHASNRRLFQNQYSMSALVAYEPYVDECAAIFSRRLLEFASARKPVNMGHWFQCYAFDVVGGITYGKRLGFLDEGEDIGGIIGNLEVLTTYGALVSIYWELHAYLHRIASYFAGGTKGDGRAYVARFTQERIAEQKAVAQADSEKASQDDFSRTEPFLRKFLLKNEENPATFTKYHIMVGCSANMLAGSDTTAISLSATLYHLMKYPETMAKLRTEIDEFTKEGKLSGFPTFSESQAMPYFQAVLKEALRMHPATGLPLERVVPEDGATIGGYYFPPGSVVGINSWVEHRNKEYFGNDADEFRPERWLTEDAGQLSQMNRHWMPFGLGARTCIGRHISWLEMSKLVPRLVRDFDFEFEGDLARPGADWKTVNRWFVKPKGFMARATPRASKSSW